MRVFITVLVLALCETASLAKPTGNFSKDDRVGFRSEGWTVRVPSGWTTADIDGSVRFRKNEAAIIAFFLPYANYDAHLKTRPPPLLTPGGGIDVKTTTPWRPLEIPGHKALEFEGDVISEKLKEPIKGFGRSVVVFGTVEGWIGAVTFTGVGSAEDFHSLAAGVAFNKPDFGPAAERVFGAWCTDEERIVSIEKDGFARIFTSEKLSTGPYVGIMNGDWQFHGYGTYYAGTSTLTIRWKDLQKEHTCEELPAKGNAKFTELRCSGSVFRRCDP